MTGRRDSATGEEQQPITGSAHMMLPQGTELTPHGVMGIVTGDELPRGVIYRRRDGLVYYMGLREDRPIWKECGYQIVGSVPFVRRRFAEAEGEGIRERSIPWYLLTDAERQAHHDWRQAEE